MIEAEQVRALYTNRVGTQRAARTLSQRKVSFTVHLDPEQEAMLRALSQHTKVPAVEYIRQGINKILLRELA